MAPPRFLIWIEGPLIFRIWDLTSPVHLVRENSSESAPTHLLYRDADGINLSEDFAEITKTATEEPDEVEPDSPFLDQNAGELRNGLDALGEPPNLGGALTLLSVNFGNSLGASSAEQRKPCIRHIANAPFVKT